MIRILVPVMIVAIIAIVALVIHKRQSKVGELKRLRYENAKYKVLVATLDSTAADEYTVTNSPYAGTVLDAIRRMNTKEIA